MSFRVLLLSALYCAVNLGSPEARAELSPVQRTVVMLADAPDSMRKLFEREIDIQTALVGVVGRGNVPTDVLSAAMHKGWTVAHLRRVIQVIDKVDRLPGIQPEIAALLTANPGDGSLQKRIARLEMFRKLDSMIRVVGINVPTSAGTLDVLLEDGTAVAMVSLKQEGPHGNPQQINEDRVASAAEHLQKVAPGAHRLIFTTGGAGASRLSADGSGPDRPAVINADSLQLNGQLYQFSLQTFFAGKSLKPKQPIEVADRKVEQLLRQNGPAQAFIRWNPTAMTAFRDLVRAQEVDWGVLSRLLSNPRAASRINVKLLHALQVLGEVPGLELTIERMLSSSDRAYQAGFVYQILQAAELHQSEGLVAMSMPVPGQTMDVDALTRTGKIYELKMLSSEDALVASASIREGHRGLRQQREALKVVRRYLPLPPEVRVGAELVLLSNRPMTSAESEQAQANAEELGITVSYETESTVRVKRVDISPGTPAGRVLAEVKTDVPAAAPSVDSPVAAKLGKGVVVHSPVWKGRPRLPVTSRRHLQRLQSRKARAR